MVYNYKITLFLQGCEEVQEKKQYKNQKQKSQHNYLHGIKIKYLYTSILLKITSVNKIQYSEKFKALAYNRDDHPILEERKGH